MHLGLEEKTYTLLSVNRPWRDAQCEELFAVCTYTAGLQARRIVKAGDYRLLLVGGDLGRVQWV